MDSRILSFKAIVTVLLGVAYIGPVFGMAIGFWFRETAS